MKVKGIVIDVGGVLVQTKDVTKRRLWEARLGLKPGQLSHVVYSLGPGTRATLGEVSSDYIWRMLQKRFALNDTDLTSLRTDFYEGNRLNTTFFNFMKTLKEQYKIVILSDTWDNFRQVYTEKFHLQTLTDTMILSAEEGLKKPDDAFMQLALNALGTQPAETLYIDDTPLFILHAKKRHMKTVLFVDTESAIEQIKAVLA